MARLVTPLSELKIKKAKARGKEYKLFDGGGYIYPLRQREVSIEPARDAILPEFPKLPCCPANALRLI